MESGKELVVALNASNPGADGPNKKTPERKSVLDTVWFALVYYEAIIAIGAVGGILIWPWTDGLAFMLVGLFYLTAFLVSSENLGIGGALSYMQVVALIIEAFMVVIGFLIALAVPYFANINLWEFFLTLAWVGYCIGTGFLFYRALMNVLTSTKYCEGSVSGARRRTCKGLLQVCGGVGLVLLWMCVLAPMLGN